MGLIAAELERQGITTVCLVLLREVAEEVRPPRAMHVPFPHGFALGQPNDPEGQRRVIEAALRRFGCSAGHPPGPVARELLGTGRAVTGSGHRIRLIAFGSTDGASGARAHAVSLGHVERYLEDYVR